MTTDLDRLIEAVEAGRDIFPTDFPPDFPKRQWALRASEGSLDAAVTLLEVLLPGWDWCLNSRHYWEKSEGPLALIKTGQPGVDLKVVDAKGSTPARALLLAALRAKLAEAESGQS